MAGSLAYRSDKTVIRIPRFPRLLGLERAGLCPPATSWRRNRTDESRSTAWRTSRRAATADCVSVALLPRLPSHQVEAKQHSANHHQNYRRRVHAALSPAVGREEADRSSEAIREDATWMGLPAQVHPALATSRVGHGLWPLLCAPSAAVGGRRIRRTMSRGGRLCQH